MKNPIKVLNKRQSPLKALLSFFNENETEDNSKIFDYYRSIAKNDDELNTINLLEKSSVEIMKIEEEFFSETPNKKKMNSNYDNLLESNKKQGKPKTINGKNNERTI